MFASKRARLLASAVIGALLVFAAIRAWAGADAAAALPKDFPAKWSHVRSLAVPDRAHAMYGFHNVYANKAAQDALKKKAPLPEGAAFISSIYDVVNDRGVLSAGAKRRDVMRRRDKAAAETGGWTYAAFDATGKPMPIDAAKDCHGCHAEAPSAADLAPSKDPKDL